MKGPDLDRQRSEQRVTRAEFIAAYNTNLPEAFPPVSPELLEIYEEGHPGQFKVDGLWSLDQHRKRIMDWLPMYLKSREPKKRT